MNLLKTKLGLAILFSVGLIGNASSALITDENFEAGATGWSNNLTTSHVATSRFLGRFGGTSGNQSIFKNYTLTGNQTQVTIEFDFYEIDSWDGELFNVFVDDSMVFSSQFWTNSHYAQNDDPVDTATVIADPTNSGTQNLAFSGWADEFFHFTITAANSSNNLKLGFGTTLNQGLSDESWGIDNVSIVSNAQAVSEPTSLALLGLGLLGFGALRKNKKS